jgi:branched-chain amino acid transport system permease protein
MMGFAGQLSLGHALYVGLAAYLSAFLFIDYGIGPWIGLLGAIPLAAAAGAVIAFLALRFRVGGVYFAILTIAFAEFARIGFDHLSIVNGSGGLFLPVTQSDSANLWLLRGPPTMFYYVILAATSVALLISRYLLRSRIGYFWQAIREDEQAAEATGIDIFRYKMAAVVISAAMTAFAGVFYAFYYNNLFPEQVFSVSRSIEYIIAPIIGGLGTLFGPIVGAFLLTSLSELQTEALALLGLDIPGARQVLYGVCLLFVIVALPGGVWPWLARRFSLHGDRS